MTKLEQSILSTLCFFDIFEYPLTLFELWKWQYQITDLRLKIKDYKISDVLEVLESEKLKRFVEQENGLYFLKGREPIIKTRQKREQISQYKFRKALRMARLLAKVPFVKMIAVCNDLAYNNAPSTGDIDFFIITHSKRIWTTRFFCALVLKILKQRPTEKEKKDKICLSFFITDDNLNLEPIANKPEDIYLVYWINQLVPIYDQGIYRKFLKANQWTKRFLPNSSGVKSHGLRQIKLPWFWPRSFAFNGLTEKFYGWLQLKILPKSLKQLLNKGTAVIANDKMLKFHKYDQREHFQKETLKRLDPSPLPKKTLADIQP